MKMSAWLALAVIVTACGFGARGVIHAASVEEELVAILNGSYEVSCRDVDQLRQFYSEDAEIVHDGRQRTLDETIKELKQSTESLNGLTCKYEPKVRVQRILDQVAYLVVRETIRMTAQEMEEQRLEQVCTYVFVKQGTMWKIAHDHCSSVRGQVA